MICVQLLILRSEGGRVAPFGSQRRDKYHGVRRLLRWQRYSLLRDRRRTLTGPPGKPERAEDARGASPA